MLAGSAGVAAIACTWRLMSAIHPTLHAPSAELVACFPEHKSRGPGCFASLSKPAAGPDRATLSRARRRSRYGTLLPPRTAGRRAEGRQAARFERTRPAPQDWAAQDS